MVFEEMKTGYPVYALHTDGDIKVSVGKIVSVSAPKFDLQNGLQNVTANNINAALASSKTVDVLVDIDGKNSMYSIPEKLSVTQAGPGLILSAAKDGLLLEVTSLKTQSEEAVKAFDKHKKRIEDCSAILMEYDTAYKDKRAAEEKFTFMEKEIREIKELIKGMVPTKQ